MKDIKILELTASNFKAQNFHDVYKDINYLSGKNGSGKSTRISAWLWLISGRTDAVSPANHLLFDNRVELSPDTPTAKVEAVVSIDGETYKIRREATASFQRKRGTSDYVKSASDSYKFFVDDIERNSGDFKEWISANLCDADLIAYTLSGDFFINRLYEDKKGCRQLIEKLVGNVERSEMQGNYSAIDELLQRFTLDEIDARAQNMAKAINDRLNEIPALIRNKENEIAEIEQTDFVATDREITELEAERDRLDKQMTDLTERINPQMEAKHEAERTYQMKKDVMEKAYEDWKKSFDVRRQKLTDEIAAIRQQNAKSEKARSDEEARRKMLAQDIEADKKLLELTKQKRERLLADRDREKAVTMDENGTICPHCGAQLHGEKLQEVLDRFEKVKRERIEAIVNEGKRTAAEIEALEKRIADMQKQLDEPLPQV
ncbi:MAG: AAA family ATPase, partial [Bacteroidales bacterium]|nr:AAA family ATPase [Bacteroidales bacterium]